MRRLLFICLVMCLAGCGLFKKNTKNKLVEKNETSSVTQVKTNEIITDKSKITIIEKADTSAYTKPQLASGTNKIGLHVDSLVNGLTAISNDLLDVKMVLDSNGVLTTTAFIKPQKVDLQFDRNIQIDKDVFANKSGELNQQITEKKYVKSVQNVSEPTGIGMLGYLGIAALVLFFIWLVWRK